MIALTPRSTFSYVLKRDRDLPKGEQTVFQMRALTVEERAFLTDQFVRVEQQLGEDKRTFVSASGSQNLQAVRAGLIGWSNLRATKGEVAFERQKLSTRILGRACNPVTDECLEHLGDDVIAELAEQVIEQNHLTEADRKN